MLEWKPGSKELIKIIVDLLRQKMDPLSWKYAIRYCSFNLFIFSCFQILQRTYVESCAEVDGLQFWLEVVRVIKKSLIKQYLEIADGREIFCRYGFDL